MAEQKKNIARLVLKGISVLGILLGISSFLCGFVMILPPWEDDVGILPRLIFSATAFVLGAFLMYPSYKMLRGRSFLVIKSMAALLGLIVSGFCYLLTDVSIVETSRIAEEIVGFATFLLAMLVFVLVYKICVKLLGKLRIAAYGLEEISEAHHSTE